MRTAERNLEDLACEVKGISALTCVLSSFFLEQDNRFADGIIGESLFAIQNYAERISDELMDYEREHKVSQIA